MFYLIYKLFHRPEGPLRFLRLFKSQPFRAMCAAGTAFLLMFVIMPWFIRLMRRWGVGEQARHYSELNAGRKSVVPTMGGAVLLFAVVAATLLWCDPASGFVIIALLAGLAGGALGAADDVAKLRGGHSDTGLSRTVKYCAQFAIGAFLAFAVMHEAFSPLPAEVRHVVYPPFYKWGFSVGWANAALVAVFVVLMTNAVNLTDGMDGLAAVPSVLALLVLAVFAYLISRVDTARFLQFFYWENEFGRMVEHNLPGAGELSVLCCGAAGACAGFLWYNAFPATVMMGDTGAMGLGALLAAVAVLIRQEAVLLVAGGVFIIEIASVFIQDYIGLKCLGRRIFFRAPYHSALLHRGLSENKVTVRLWILSAAFAVFALTLLKLR
jgi:phospho-N-acetylmuramoyl-pentapeptide-transferase